MRYTEPFTMYCTFLLSLFHQYRRGLSAKQLLQTSIAIMEDEEDQEVLVIDIGSGYMKGMAAFISISF